ncbi:DUF2255 family protein [Umezawaea sp. Da 62-37]|uniref:DUF2255 family protein n=1 Tax=Umezawaea sp. Da 62-37 TaxID=3075927 RepID=UPI0028F6EA6A|nr:DUF2255 family protein [Umezawaea sp. Da 62-37]WNV87542.1 DUF2255 family protein [Umezawaea sp. Da 62-37]
MTTWTEDELTRIGSAEELEIASRRTDGTLRTPRTIWVVRVGGDLYVRSVNGVTSDWYRGTRTSHEGRVDAGGATRDVALVDVGAETAEQVDAAYRAKYRRYAASIIDAITSPTAREATIKLVPAGTTRG